MTESNPLDSDDVRGALAGRGREFERAAVAARLLALPSIGGVTNVVIDMPAVGSAGGGVGDAVAAVTISTAAVPIVASNDGAHSWADHSTLLIVADPEAAQHGRDRGAIVIDVSGIINPGGAVGGVAGGQKFVPCVAVCLVVLDRLGLVGEMDADIAQAVRVLDDVESAHGAKAASLARRVGRTMPIIYGAGPIGAVVSSRWKTSVNRYAKAPAFANHIPGLDFDEVCGWAQHGDVTRQIMSLIALRHGIERPEHSARLDSTVETCEEIVAGVHEVHSSDASPLAQLVELVVVGEWFAVEMAAVAGIDPGPVPILDRY